MQFNSINKRKVFPKRVCNGQSFCQFALSNGANKIADRVAPYDRGTTPITGIAMTPQQDMGYSVTF